MNYDNIKERDKILYSKWKTDQDFMNRISRYRVVDEATIADSACNSDDSSTSAMVSSSNDLPLVRPPPSKPKVIARPTKLVNRPTIKIKPVIKPRNKDRVYFGKPCSFNEMPYDPQMVAHPSPGHINFPIEEPLVLTPSIGLVEKPVVYSLNATVSLPPSDNHYNYDKLLNIEDEEAIRQYEQNTSLVTSQIYESSNSKLIPKSCDIVPKAVEVQPPCELPSAIKCGQMSKRKKKSKNKLIDKIIKVENDDDFNFTEKTETTIVLKKEVKEVSRGDELLITNNINDKLSPASKQQSVTTDEQNSKLIEMWKLSEQELKLVGKIGELNVVIEDLQKRLSSSTEELARLQSERDLIHKKRVNLIEQN